MREIDGIAVDSLQSLIDKLQRFDDTNSAAPVLAVLPGDAEADEGRGLTGRPDGLMAQQGPDSSAANTQAQQGNGSAEAETPSGAALTASADEQDSISPPAEQVAIEGAGESPAGFDDRDPMDEAHKPRVAPGDSNPGGINVTGKGKPCRQRPEDRQAGERPAPEHQSGYPSRTAGPPERSISPADTEEAVGSSPVTLPAASSSHDDFDPWRDMPACLRRAE